MPSRAGKRLKGDGSFVALSALFHLSPVARFGPTLLYTNMRSAIALVFAGSVAAHFVNHHDHENFLRSLHSSNFPPTRVKRQNEIPPLESLGPNLPQEPAVPLRATPTPGTKSPVNGAPDLPAG